MGCLYNVDDRDDQWLAEHNAKCERGEIPPDASLTVDQLEWLMWGLEKSTSEKVECLHFLLVFLSKYVTNRHKKIIHLTLTATGRFCNTGRSRLIHTNRNSTSTTTTPCIPIRLRTLAPTTRH